VVPASRIRHSRDLRDQELASRIAQEVTRNLLLINYLIELLSNRKITKTDPIVRKIIGIGLAQILFLDRIPHPAAVNEAVEQTKRFGKKSASGFVNALLRRAAREPLPHLDDDPVAYARVSLSHPQELVDRILEVMGPEKFLELCRHNQRRPPTILRLSPGVMIDQLQTEGVTLTTHERPGMLVMQPTIAQLLIEWSIRALAQPQDPTSASVVDFCDIQPGMTVLDRCSGMGTKTIQLRERVGESGTVVAIDRNEMRVDALRMSLQHRRISNVHVVAGSKVEDAEPWVPDEGFDRVLADVPCSNSGVLARRTVAKYFQDDATLASLRKLQLQILEDTFPALAPRGLLIYSTCSIWPEENQRMVQSFLQAHSDLTLLREASTLPSFDTDDPTRYHDGGYVAVLQRS
jgi:16S rRNA (cytosine967-C5)-methyltransferase